MSKITALIPLRKKIIDHIMEHATKTEFVFESRRRAPNMGFDLDLTDAQLVVLRENIFRIKDHRGEIFPRHTIRARMHELRNDPKTPKIVSDILNAMVEKAGRPYP